jgi:isopentenyl diphosphate isomerase/L-lactate dehydrogenase-like FMN-dependent dehydrogenase
VKSSDNHLNFFFASSSRILIKPKLLRKSVADTDTNVELLQGRAKLQIPIGVAPTAFQKLAHPEGEIGMARGQVIAGQ